MVSGSTKFIQRDLVTGKAIPAFSLLMLAWYMLGALVLGTLLAKWSWVLLKSPATVTAIAPSHDTSGNAGQLFGVVSEANSAAAAVLPNVKLVGVFAPDSGSDGFAVLSLDEQHQVGVVAGGTVAPGVKLLEVHPDHVVLDRSGVHQRIELVNVNADAAGTGIVPAGK